MAVLLACAMLAASCAAGRAFRSGEEAARGGNWDAAVEYYRVAVHEGSYIVTATVLDAAGRRHSSSIGIVVAED